MASKPVKCMCIESSENFTMASLVQFFAWVPQLSTEVEQLVEYLRALNFKQVVIYVHDAIRCATLSGILKQQGFGATFIHELLPHPFRMARLMMFREMDTNASVLVTSCCGHAMEFKNADAVILFDEAESVDTYTHLISSRQARKGLVINLIRKDEHLAILRQVEKLHNVSILPLPDHLHTAAYLQNGEEETS